MTIESRIHDVFHISLLKPFFSSAASPDQLALPAELRRGRPPDTPVRASAERTILVGGIPLVQWLVHWASDVNAAPTWESAAELAQSYPHLHLEDKVNLDRGELIGMWTWLHGQPTKGTNVRPMRKKKRRAKSKIMRNVKTMDVRKEREIHQTAMEISLRISLIC